MARDYPLRLISGGAHPEIIEEVRDAAKNRDDAMKRYNEAIKKAAEAGVSNVKISLAAGVSETAIRTHRKRNNL